MRNGYAPGRRRRHAHHRLLDGHLENCVFEDNATGMTDWHGGGAVYADRSGTPVFNDCVFRNNRAFAGGALYGNHGGRVTFDDCRFIDNPRASRRRDLRYHHRKDRLPLCRQRAADWGGAVWHNSLLVDYYESCTFDGNGAPMGRHLRRVQLRRTPGDDRHHHFQLSEGGAPWHQPPRYP